LNRVKEHLRKQDIKLTARPSLKKQAIEGRLAGILKSRRSDRLVAIELREKLV